MPYSESLAGRVRDALRDVPGVQERRMFGGLGFLVRGHLCVGLWHDALIARVGPEAYAAALRAPHVREFDITGRAMRGWVLVEPEGLDLEADLRGWVSQALAHARRLPPK